MKKTTYILIGTLAASFILLILFPILLSFTDKKDMEKLNELNIDSTKSIEKQYTNIKAIKFENNNKIKRMVGCNVNISPSDSIITSVSLPQSKYFTSSQKCDTLIISMNIDKEVYINRRIIKSMNNNIVNISIKTPQELHYVNVNSNFVANMDGMKGDSLCATIYQGGINLNKSTYRALNINGWNGKFNAKNSTIDSLYIDMDERINWTIEKSNINTEFLTGGNRANYYFGEKECKRIVWRPKDDDAKLQLSGKSDFIITPCN